MQFITQPSDSLQVRVTPIIIETIGHFLKWGQIAIVFLFFFRVLLGKLSTYFSMILNQYVNPYLNQSNDWRVLEVSSIRSELDKTGFSFAATSSWNLLQSTFKLDSLLSLNQFKPKTRDFCVSSRVCFIWFILWFTAL